MREIFKILKKLKDSEKNSRLLKKKTQCYGVSLTQWDSIIGQIVLKITLVSEKTHLTNDLSRVSKDTYFFRGNLFFTKVMEEREWGEDGSPFYQYDYYNYDTTPDGQPSSSSSTGLNFNVTRSDDENYVDIFVRWVFQDLWVAILL